MSFNNSSAFFLTRQQLVSSRLSEPALYKPAANSPVQLRGALVNRRGHSLSYGFAHPRN